MEQLDDGRSTHVLINWSRPYTPEEIKAGMANCSKTCFYKILGVYNNRYKLFYIGKCVEQYVNVRIFQPDHIRKQATFKEQHKKHKLMVSLGNVEDCEEYGSSFFDNVERLLIYSHSKGKFTYIKNKQCRLSHNVVKNYHIVNDGWRKEGMYHAIGYGLYFRN